MRPKQQTSSAEGSDLRNLSGMLCRVRENDTRSPRDNEQIVARIIDLRALCEQIGYGRPGSNPASEPGPSELPIVVSAKGQAANGPRKARR